MPKIDFTGYIRNGHDPKTAQSDGAYDLIGTWELEEFIIKLRECLQNGVKPMLGTGMVNDGLVLSLEIYDEGNAPK